MTLTTFYKVAFCFPARAQALHNRTCSGVRGESVGKLAKQEPANAGSQRDLSVSYNKVGDVQSAQGDPTGALKSYRDSLAIFEKFAKQDPGNAGWQADLAFSYWRTGTRLARSDAQSKKDARTMVEKRRDILRALKTRTGLTRQQQQWLDSI